MVLFHFESETFEDVAESTYWTWAQLVKMNVGEITTKTVKTNVGIVVYGLVMTSRSILWILPIGHIKASFDRSKDSADKLRHMKESTEYLINKPRWSDWWGLSGAARIYIEIYRCDALGTRIPGIAPATKACIQVPLLQARPVHEFLEIPLGRALKRRLWWWERSAQEPNLLVRLGWQPSKEMASAEGPSEPQGGLTLSVLSGNFWNCTKSQLWEVVVHVPVGTAALEIVSRAISCKKGGPNPIFKERAHFMIHWSRHQQVGEKNNQIFDTREHCVQDPPAADDQAAVKSEDHSCIQNAGNQNYDTPGANNDFHKHVNSELADALYAYIAFQQGVIAEQNRKCDSLESEIKTFPSAHVQQE